MPSKRSKPASKRTATGASRMSDSKHRSQPNTKKIQPAPYSKRITNSKKPTGNPGNNSTPALNKIQPSGKREESFFELVYEVARQIPYGRVTSYGAIAACLGTKLSARMVGWAMNGADKINPTVPAHRVVNRVGLLSGKHHFKPPGKMEKLLKKEGILVKDDVIVNFKEKFWDPAGEFEKL
jgi:methylated-DNA-protein-cysteine methyltransferase related protein